MVNVRDVAALAAVSVGTVSNVLNSPARVSAATRQRVEDAIEELGFIRNDAARQLRMGHSATLGFVITDVTNPFFTAIARAAQVRARDLGFTVLLSESGGEPATERAQVDLFYRQRSRGVLLTPSSGWAPTTVIAETPLVLVGQTPGPAELPSVVVDDRSGGEIAAQHLIGLGRRRLAFVGGPRSIPQVEQRWAGASFACRRAGNPIEYVEARAMGVVDGRQVGRDLASRPLEHRPDAIFAANDLLATGIMQALVLERSVRVPQDIALIGYDDIDFAAATVVPLSTIRQPAEVLGARAVDLAIAPQSGVPARLVLQPQLVVRASTADRSVSLLNGA